MLHRILEDGIAVETAGKGRNVQAKRDRLNFVVAPKAYIMNMANLVVDQWKALPLGSGFKIDNYLAPADIFKKYKEVEIQQQIKQSTNWQSHLCHSSYYQDNQTYNARRKQNW